MPRLQPKMYISKFCSVKMIGTITLKASQICLEVVIPNSLSQVLAPDGEVERKGIVTCGWGRAVTSGGRVVPSASAAAGPVHTGGYPHLHARLFLAPGRSQCIQLHP